MPTPPKNAIIFDASSQSVSEVASEPKTVALGGCPGRPRRLPRGPRELPEPPWSVPGTPPEHPRRSPGEPNACNRAPVTSKRRPGTSKSSLRRPPGPHFGASGSENASFLVFFLDIPERKFPGGGGESPQALSIIRCPLAGVSEPGVSFCQILSDVCNLHATPAPPHPLYQSELVRTG